VTPERVTRSRGTSSPTFTGAALPVGEVDVLVVVVHPWVLASDHEARLYALAFAHRFRRAIVLMAQDARGVPTYYGPGALVHALGKLPLEVVPWQRFELGRTRTRSWKLPIPREPPADDDQTTGFESARHAGRMAR
jgi:hypothetical protein